MEHVRYSAALLSLAETPEQTSLARVWAQLSRDDQAKALESALNAKRPPWLREILDRVLVETLKGYRLTTVMRWSNTEIAARAVKQRISKPAVLRAGLVSLHLPGRRHLQEAFLDLAGVAHVEGELEDLPEPYPTKEVLAAAAEQFIARHPGDESLFYLLAIRCVRPEYWSGLDDWFRMFGRAAGSAPGESAVEAEQVIEAQGVEVPSIASTVEPVQAVSGYSAVGNQADPFFHNQIAPEDGLSTALSELDEALERMILDSFEQTEGALSEAQVDSAVAEFVRMNRRRVQSRHHVGLRDALFGRQAVVALETERPDACRWYFAGHIKGLAYRREPEKCLALYDTQVLVRELGDTGLGPSAIGSPPILDALIAANRFEEASRFISVTAATNSVGLCERLLAGGTNLLRQERPAQAREYFEILWRALAERMGDEREVPVAMWTDVRRRYAHCLRYEDNPAGARMLLNELLLDPTDANRAAVLTDLALLDAGYRRLHELRLPATQDRLTEMVRDLARGGQHLDEALRLESPTSAHAHYVMGMMHLLSGQYVTASRHLDVALSFFERRPEVYRGGHLLERARLHLGLSLCLGLDQSQTDRGRRLLQKALEVGERVPVYLMADLLLALSMTDYTLAAELADELLAGAGEDVVDELARSSVASKSAPIVDALLRRARASDRSLTARAQDWYTILPLLLSQRRIAEADEGLDALEGMALSGVLEDRYTQLLNDEHHFGPAWTVDEASWSRVRCLEARGRYEEAAGLLQQIFQRAFALGGADGRQPALEVVERLEDYGSEVGDIHEVILRRFRDHFEQVEDGDGDRLSETAAPIRVMVVGGNEAQARFDDLLRLELTHKHPNISVDFFHTGWTSNWGVQLDEFERRVGQFDGVVFSRYMRTMLGRSARKVCQIPWRGCGGRGRAAFQRSVLEVARAVMVGRGGQGSV